MKKIITLFAIVALITSCKNKNADTKLFSIKGKAKGIDSGEIYIQTVDKAATKMDTIKIVKGEFVYEKKCETPQLSIIILARANGKIDAKNTKFFFVEPNVTAAVTIDTTATERIIINDSKLNDELTAFKKNTYAAVEEKEKKSFENINPMLLSKAEMDSLMLKYKQIQQEKKDVVINYIKANKNSFVGAGYAYLLSIQDQEMDNAFVKKAYENVGDNIKNSFYGIEFKNSLATASKVEVGSTTPNFTVNDVNDKPITLSEFYKGKKLVLIDFWASWCGPCRKENPNVVAAYKQFNDKGFEVIGVSLDEDKTDWMNAIAKDKLVWQQVNDLKGWQSGVAKTYNVTGIPTNFLIDGNGKVIAQNLRGIDLENKLKELLK